MEKIYFGSGDSLDIDVVYIFDVMPDLQECKSFCSEKDENRNIVCINNGIVTESYKGTKDEMNNVIYNTFHLHKQILKENPIKHLVKRDLALKSIRTVRGLLSSLSRTEYREDIKKALKSNDWIFKLDVLLNIDFNNIKDFIKDNQVETFKFLAFQVGQTLALIYGKEIYTKKDLADLYPILNDFLYRKENINEEQLNSFYKFFKDFLIILRSYNIDYVDDKNKDNSFIIFKDFFAIYDLKKELKIKEYNWHNDNY